MNGYLNHLLGRTLGDAPVLQPRVAGMFEPVAALPPLPGETALPVTGLHEGPSLPEVTTLHEGTALPEGTSLPGGTSLHEVPSLPGPPRMPQRLRADAPQPGTAGVPPAGPPASPPAGGNVNTAADPTTHHATTAERRHPAGRSAGFQPAPPVEETAAETAAAQPAGRRRSPGRGGEQRRMEGETIEPRGMAARMAADRPAGSRRSTARSVAIALPEPRVAQTRGRGVGGRVAAGRARMEAGRGNGEASERQHAASDATPDIRITIGRVDVRAVVRSDAPRTTTREPQGPRLTLEDYLRTRDGGRR